MKNSVVITFFVIVVLILTAPIMRNALLLNRGLLAWNKMGANDEVKPEFVLDLLTLGNLNRDGALDWVLGHTYWQANQQEQAIRHWQSFGQANAVQQMISVSNFLSERGDVEYASEWLTRAASLNCCLVDVWFHYGQNTELTQDMNLALTYYEKALNFPVSSCDYYSYSDVFYHMGTVWYHRISPPDEEKAYGYYEAAMLYNDFHDSFSESNNLYQMAHILFRQDSKNDPEVISLLEHALEINPNHSWANWLMGKTIYRDDGDFDKTLYYLLNAWRVDKESHWIFCFQLGELYEGEGKVDEAISFYRCALDNAPDSEQATLLERLERLNSR